MSFRSLAEIEQPSAYDVVVAGAGAAGMAAALFAAMEKQKVLLIERTEYVGGTSALSGGTIWVPNTHHSVHMDGSDSEEQAAQFLNAAVGNYSSEQQRRAFLRVGPDAIKALEDNSSVKLRPYAAHPDYEQQHAGATMRGRALEPLPFDGRMLGDNLKYIRPPIPEFTILGGMMVDRTDIGHLLNMRRNIKSLKHALKIIGLYALDRMKGEKRGTRLVMGNALIGRLLHSLLDRGVDIVTAAHISAINTENRHVQSVTVKQRDVTRTIDVTRAIVLAGGGFGRDPDRRAQMLHQPVPEFSPAAPGHTGALQHLACELGAKFGKGGADNAFWAPVSLRKRKDGSMAVFPHFVMDRSKPGTMCVNQLGQRFVNESTSYHNFVRAMFDANKAAPTIPCFIVCDSVALKKYGLGMVRMGTKDVSGFTTDGYLLKGETLSALAQEMGVPADQLHDSVIRMNSFVETGVDTDFGRGQTAYHRHNGDNGAGFPNPTLGPISTGPFYAVRLFPGDIGASTGLAIDEDARVLGQNNVPIGKLYACGAEAQSIMGGTYPAPGITLGPAIVFAYRAIKAAMRSPEVV